MSAKRKSYSADFKTKLALEVLEGEKTINEIASKSKKLEEYLEFLKYFVWKLNFFGIIIRLNLLRGV